MFRIITIGLTALILVVCKPATSVEAAQPQAAPAAVAPAPFDDSAFEALEARWLEVPNKPTDPIDELDWREVHCNFLAGEIGGNVEQDGAINARLKVLRCFSQDEDALALKASSAGDSAALARLEIYFARNAG